LQRRILIIRTDKVGDVVVMTPMIREIRKKFPGAYIGTLTQPHTSSILLNNPHLDVILTDDLRKDTFRQVIKEIKKHKFTDALLIWPSERAAYQLFLAGIRNRIGVGRKLYEVITFMKSVSRNNYVPLRHEADYSMDLARKIGVTTNNLTPEIFITEEEKKEAEFFLEKHGIRKEHFKIIIHTGSGNSAPNWSENKYLDLINRLAEKYSNRVKIILTSVEASAEFKEKVTESCLKDIVIDLSSGLNPLRKLITVISAVDLLVSCSTGPMHIASALKVNTVSIFCHRPMSRPARWGALGDKAVNIEVPADFCDKYCSPDKEKCAIEEGITLESVLKEADRVILKF
jgi:heptosyltransferase-2